MRLPGFLSVNHKLAVAVWLEKYLGVRFVWYPEGAPVPEVPWDVLVIEFTKADVVWIMNLCADVGGPCARSDLLFLNSVLEQIQAVTAP
jgi:hypothetical protein